MTQSQQTSDTSDSPDTYDSLDKLNVLISRVALDKQLRPSTVGSYRRLLRALPDYPDVYAFVLSIENLNTRRATIIAVRSVLGVSIKIPKALPRHYELASDDTYRLAIMLSKYSHRGLLMYEGGLRVGEACAVTSKSLDGRWLRVDRQVQTLNGKDTLTQVKGTVGRVAVPMSLVPVIEGLDSLDNPACVRESLRRAGKKVGISLNPHQLRHAYLTKLVNAGVPLPVIQRQARHSDISTTLRTYYNMNDKSVLGMLDSLE